MKLQFFSFVSAVALLTAGGCVSEDTAFYDSGSGDSMPAEDFVKPVSAVARKSEMAVRSMETSVPADNNFQAPEGRQMAFTARLLLNVADVRAALLQARDCARSLGGYVKRMNDRSITLAVPVKRGDDALKALAKTGSLESVSIDGEDVTEQTTDLAVRLDNLEKSRQRLLALLEKAGKVEEMVKVEKELTRVTTELERLQAQQKKLRGQIEYITIYVNFNVRRPVVLHTAVSPVGWVNQLGSVLLNPPVMIPMNASPESFLFGLQLPDGFVQSSRRTAVSGDGCVISLHTHGNAAISVRWYGNKYADLSFYRGMIEKVLKNRFPVPVSVRELKVDGLDALEYSAEPVIGGKKYVYRVVAAVDGDTVNIIEAYAGADVFAGSLPADKWQNFLNTIEF